ncbi:MAG: peptide chain release factor N(5)-glutamine methyltransferase, partial [Methylibium sp.]|nr:peptide chain release factor N(5)-glutamine methyltransferase [Methylibium sp.]
MHTVAAALRTARGHGVDRLDAQALLSAVLRQPRAWLLAHDEAALEGEAQTRFQALLERRAQGEPLAYLLGAKEFFGLPLAVTPDVLVPRPDTETLVEWALELLPADSRARVADLGTGSGAIALALARRRPLARITAVDVSAAALAVARGNGERLGLAVQWLQSDWFEALAGRRFELIVSNPPYVAEGDTHLEALSHEPRQALTAGTDGLDAIRRIAAQAPARLEPGGWLLLEHGFEQADAVAGLLAKAGFRDIAMRRDLGGRPRCTGGRVVG